MLNLIKGSGVELFLFLEKEMRNEDEKDRNEDRKGDTSRKGKVNSVK